MCVRNQAFCQNAMMVLISGVQLFTVMSFDQTSYSVSESSGNITVTVFPIGGTVAGDEVVTVSTDPGGTATGEIIRVIHLRPSMFVYSWEVYMQLDVCIITFHFSSWG